MDGRGHLINGLQQAVAGVVSTSFTPCYSVSLSFAKESLPEVKD